MIGFSTLRECNVWGKLFNFDGFCVDSEWYINAVKLPVVMDRASGLSVRFLGHEHYNDLHSSHFKLIVINAGEAVERNKRVL